MTGRFATAGSGSARRRALGRPFPRLAALLLAAPVLAAPALAHPLAPSLLELSERDGQRVEMTWKISSQNPLAALLEPVPPAGCRPTGRAEGDREAPRGEVQREVLQREVPAVSGAAVSGAGAVVWRWELDCAAPLAGSEIGVAGLDRTDGRVLVRAELSDGRTARAILDPETPRWRVPERTSAWAVAGSYLELGFEHILGGFDHLLFVLGLLFLVAGARALAATITAFTVGHSVTLSLAVLGLVRLPSAWVELAIAASIFVLAVQLATREGPDRTRRPWWMAGFFGLLHGLGFAGALAEAGLPQGEIPIALLSFNVGIELGQLLFVAAVLGLVAILERLPRRAGPRPLAERLALPAAYLIGAVAFAACLERAADLWRLAAPG